MARLNGKAHSFDISVVVDQTEALIQTFLSVGRTRYFSHSSFLDMKIFSGTHQIFDFRDRFWTLRGQDFAAQLVVVGRDENVVLDPNSYSGKLGPVRRQNFARSRNVETGLDRDHHSRPELDVSRNLKTIEKPRKTRCDNKFCSFNTLRSVITSFVTVVK